MYYTNEFLKKKRPETFMDYNPGEIPKKNSTTVGAIYESPAKTTTVTTTKKRDPFLEGFYSTEDKPETERKTYLQHRTPAVEKVSTEIKKPESVKLPYRPSVQGQAKTTKLPYIPAQDGALQMTQYGKQTTPVYDSPVKIVGDNVTKKDYDDFWEAFRNEGTEDKLNWVTNTANPQNTKRRQYTTYGNAKTTDSGINADKIYEDNFWGQVAVNYQEGNLELEEQQAWDEYNKNPTRENKKIAEDISAALNNFRQRNSEVLEKDVTPAWIVREFAGELPEIIDGVEDSIRQKDLDLIQDAFSDSMDEIEGKAKDIHYSRNQYNVDLPQNINELPEDWRNVIANCHQFTTENGEKYIKYVSPDGKREVIFNSTGEYVITADEDIGTYNYADPGSWIEHGIVDVLPWVLYGNTPEDSTERYERVRALLGG